MYRPSNPSKPCLTCTKQWCLDQKLQICLDAGLGEQNPDTGTGKEGDVDTRCFRERKVCEYELDILTHAQTRAGFASRPDDRHFVSSHYYWAFDWGCSEDAPGAVWV